MMASSSVRKPRILCSAKSRLKTGFSLPAADFTSNPPSLSRTRHTFQLDKTDLTKPKTHVTRVPPQPQHTLLTLHRLPAQSHLARQDTPALTLKTSHAPVRLPTRLRNAQTASQRYQPITTHRTVNSVRSRPARTASCLSAVSPCPTPSSKKSRCHLHTVEKGLRRTTKLPGRTAHP